MRRFAAVGIAIAGALALSACDDFRDVEVTNGCDQAIDVSNSHLGAGYGIATVEPGAVATAHSSGGPFDIVVRAAGTDDWGPVIRWDEMTTQDTDYLRTFVVEGDKCPAQQD